MVDSASPQSPLPPEPASSSPGATAPKKRHRLRRFFLGVGILVLLLLLLVLLLPTLLSTGFGRGEVVSFINGKMPGHVEISGLSLGWFSGQEIDGLVLKDPKGQSVIEVAAVRAPGVSLWGAMMGNMNFGTIELDSPHGHIIQNADGTTNLSEALGSGGAKPARAPAAAFSGKNSPPPSVKLVVKDGEVVYEAAGQEPVSVKSLTLTADMLDPKNIKVDTQSDVVATGGMTGKVSATGGVQNLFNADGSVNASAAVVDATVNVTGLPMAMLDRLQNMNGFHVALFGPSMDCTVTAKGNMGQMNASLRASSANFQANIALGFNKQILQLDPASSITLNVTPESYKAVAAAASPAAPPPTLLQPFQIKLSLQQFQGDFSSGSLDPATALLKASLTVDPIVANAPDLGGAISLKETNLQITSAGLSKSVDFSAHSVAAQGAQAGQMDLKGSLRNLIAGAGQAAAPMEADVTGTITDLPLPVLDKIAGLDGMLTHVIGPKLNATLTAGLKPSSGGANAATTGTFALHAAGQNLTVDAAQITAHVTAADFTLDPGGSLTATLQPAATNYFLNKPAASTAAPAAKSAAAAPAATLQVTSPITTQLKLTRFDLPFGKAGIHSLLVGLQLTLSQINLADSTGAPYLSVSNVQANVPETSLDKPLTMTVAADVADAKSKGSLQIAATLADAFNPMAGLKANVSAKDFPVALADSLGKQQGKLVATAGQHFSTLTANADTDASGTIVFSTQIVGDQIKANVSGKLYAAVPGKTGQRIVMDKSHADLNLTAAALAAWLAPAPGTTVAGAAPAAAPQPLPTMEQPIALALDITQLEAAWTLATPAAPSALDMQSVKAVINFNGTGGAMRTSDGQLDRFQSITGDVSTQDLTQLVSVTFHAVIADPASRFDTVTNINGLAIKGTALDYSAAHFKTTTTSQNFPVMLLDQLAQLRGQLPAYLGNSVSMKLTADIAPTGQSPLTLVIASQNAKANVLGIIDGGLSGNLKLSSDATASLTVTPELSKALLEKITGWVNPSSGKGPITVTIHKETFLAPLKTFDLNKMVMDADIALGTLNLQANDPITGAASTGIDLLTNAAGSGGGKNANWAALGANAFSAISSKGKSVPPETVVFTPMKLHLKDGIATYQNLTMTLRQIDFNFQGDVNLNNKANNLNMTISGASIAKEFPGLAKNFGPGKDITIPIGGTYDSPSPNLSALLPQVTKFIGSGSSSTGGAASSDNAMQDLGGLFNKKKKSAPAQPALPPKK